MSWLSLATRILPKVWRATGNATSSLWRGGSAVAGTGSKVAAAAARNPKTTAVAGVAAFAGWKKLNTPDESMGTAVGKTVREGVNGSGNFLHDAVNGFTGKETVEEVKDTTSNVLTDLKETATETKGILGSLGDTLQGVSNFLGNMFGGNGMGMFSNFFSNLTSGKVSGLGIGGLIAAGYMLFGRTGLLGKIGGAMLAMMMIGSNSQQQTQAVSQETTRQQAQNEQRGMHR